MKERSIIEVIVVEDSPTYSFIEEDLKEEDKIQKYSESQFGYEREYAEYMFFFGSDFRSI